MLTSKNISSTDDMDFETGRRELAEMSAEEESKHTEPTTIAGKVWAAVF